MRKQTQVLTAMIVLAAVAAFESPVKAQTHAAPANFRGEWLWAVYAKSRDELPPAYHDEPLKDVPGAAIYLKIKQRGKKLTGEYSGSDRFLAKLEDGEFDSTVKGNTAKLELVSGFEGTVTALLTREGNKLHWKTIKSEGESYFPNDVYLSRVVRRRRRR